MKKNILILTLCIVLIVITAACSSQNENNSASSENAGIESSVSEEISEELKEFSFESKELGFQTMLPAIASDKIETEITTREHGEETITTLVIYYVGEDDRYNVLSFDSMTENEWNIMQEEGGPVGTSLGVSPDGNVIVMNTMQSNPAKEGSADADAVDQFQKDLKTVTDHFDFISK